MQKFKFIKRGPKKEDQKKEKKGKFVCLLLWQFLRGGGPTDGWIDGWMEGGRGGEGEQRIRKYQNIYLLIT